MDNLEIAKIFSTIADILEVQEENPFKIRAYRRAAQILESLPQDIRQLYEQGKLEEIPGIGKGIAERIAELIETNQLKYYQVLKKKVPPDLLEMLTVPEVGPKTVALLYKKLHIDSIEKLRKAAQAQKLRDLPGMGARSEENILKGIELRERRNERMPVREALSLADSILEQLKGLPGVKQVSAAGSLRRMRETIGDIDILATSDTPEEVMQVFTTLPQAEEVLAKGSTKSSILTREGRQVDLRVVEEDSFGAALHYFTGSKAHNIRVRELGVKKNLKISEYGVFAKKGDKEVKIGGKEENDIFKSVGLPYIVPEIREDRGEVEAGLKNKLPQLIKKEDLKGDLHIHSKWSDGKNTVEEIAQAAKERGYQYVGICDHSQSLGVAGGVKEEDVCRRIKEIRELDEQFAGIRVLAGMEVDILSDSRLDYSEEILKEMDLVIGAIHTGFKQSREQLTKRVVDALRTGLVDILAHPTGRLLGEREPYDIDMEEVFRVAKETNTILEINAFPERMDLSDINARTAKEKGIKLAINTDAHHITQMDWIDYGIAVAKRGWLEAEDVVNTYPVSKLLELFRKTSR